MRVASRGAAAADPGVPDPLKRAASFVAATAALTAVAAFIALLVFGSSLGWMVPVESDGATGVSDLREELPEIAVLLLGVLVGAFLVGKRPRHPIPWLLMALGGGFVVATTAKVAVAYASIGEIVPPWAPYAAWVGNWIWIVGFAGGTYLFLLYPDGRPLSRRWGLLAKAGGVYLACVLVLAGLWPDIETAPGLANPFGIEALRHIEAVLMALISGTLLLLLLAIVSLVLRFVRSVGVERMQMKWMAFAAVCLGVNLVALDLGLPRWTLSISTGVVVVAIPIAVTRHRLYEIDRIISRTVTYAVISLVLVGVYVSGVIGLGAVIRAVTGSAGGEFAVAGSTLAVAALFQPVRHRVQSVVDRRFNRSTYDAMKIVESFVHRLRDEVDIEVLGHELRATTERALRPAHVSLVITDGRRT